MKKYLALAAILALLVAAYAVLGFVGVPQIARSKLRTFTADNYQRELAIGTIRFNPFTYAFEMHDVSLPDADGDALLGFERLLLKLDIATLWRFAPSFRLVELEEPRARVVVRGDGMLNLVDLTRPLETATGTAEEEEPTRLYVDRFNLISGQASFEDHARPTPFRADLIPVSFELRDFSTTETTGNAYRLDGQSKDGERFHWTGTFSLEPLAARGHFEFSDLRMRTLRDYLRETMPLDLTSGTMALAGDFDFSAAEATQLKIDLQKLSIADAGLKPLGDAGAEHVKLASIDVTATRFDLARRELAIGPVRVSGGEVRAWLEPNGELSLTRLLPPESEDQGGSSDKDAAAGPADTGSDWTITAPDITVEKLTLAFEDRQIQPAASFNLQPVEVAIAGFSNAPDTALDVTASIGLERGGTAEARGRYQLDSGSASGRVSVKALDLTAFQPYLTAMTRMTLTSGSLASQLDADLAADGALALTGGVEVTKLRAIDNALRQDFVKWDLLRAAGLEYRSDRPQLRIGTITARAPYARVIIAQDQTVNVAEILAAPSAAKPAAAPVEAQKAGAQQAAAQAQPLAVSIGTVRVTDGSMNFADFWIRPNYRVSMQQLNGTIEGLSTDPQSRAKIALDGRIDRYAPVQIGGELNLLSATLFTDVKLSFKGVEMTSVTPYAGRFAGYAIEKGKISADVSYHVENRQLKADHRFVIDQLQLGERVESPEAIRLPLRLAVALLKDRNGVIDVPLPVSGSIDDPKFRLGPIIWRAVIGLLTKIVTAPFALLGRMFGGGEEMNMIEFEPGSAELDAAGQEKLAGLKKALTERPQLQLDVPMIYSAALDGPVLAVAQLDAQQSESPQARYELLIAQHRAQMGAEAALPAAALALEKLPKKKRAAESYVTANAELEAALLASRQVSDRELEELGKQRAEAVQEVLLASGEIEPTRVFVISAAPQGGAPAATEGPEAQAEPASQAPAPPQDASPAGEGAPAAPRDVQGPAAGDAGAATKTARVRMEMSLK